MDNFNFNETDRESLTDIMRMRRDVRGNNFRPDPLPEQSLTTILNAATLAPSVGYSQPWEFVIVRDKAIKAQVRQSFEAANHSAHLQFSNDKQRQYCALKLEGIEEAPVNIAVFYKPSAMPVLGQHTMPEMGEYSVVCAVQNMWLMARSLNIGMGWVSILCPKQVKRILNAPAENKLVAYLCIGFVKTFYDSPELERLRWEKRKPLQDAIYLEGYPAESNTRLG